MWVHCFSVLIDLEKWRFQVSKQLRGDRDNKPSFLISLEKKPLVSTQTQVPREVMTKIQPHASSAGVTQRSPQKGDLRDTPKDSCEGD